MIYIFGHKNPDTDTVCASITLSYLKNKLGEKTSPRVLGDLNNETKFVLNYFSYDEPSYLNDVKIRIKNINYYKNAYINEDASIMDAFKEMDEKNITAIPIVNNHKKITGYITDKYLSKYLVNKELFINASIKNICKVLKAKVLNSVDDIIVGNVNKASNKNDQNDIVIISPKDPLFDKVINSNVSLIIIPSEEKISKRLLNKIIKNKINLIESKLDSITITNKIILSNFIKNVDSEKNPVTINKDMYYSDYKTMTHKINHTNYPIVNNKNECLGLIRVTGNHLYEKKKVILVDHNNLEQSVDGIEEANILEIIDHHNLSALGTKVPINFYSKPVGSTCTIIYDMFLERKVNIPKKIAGLLLSGIISDTLLLTSPTTTKEDKNAASKLSSLAKVDLKEFGKLMFREASSIKDKTPLEIIKSDYKSYVVNKKNIGIGQVMTTNFSDIKNNIDSYINILDELKNVGYDHVLLFVTDALKNGSYVLYDSKSNNLVLNSFSIENVYEGIFISKVISRKNQILPAIIDVLEGDLN